MRRGTTTQGEPMSDYPEHDKLSEISELSQSIGEFIEWLPTVDMFVCDTKRVKECLHSIGGLTSPRRIECRNGRLYNEAHDEDRGECDQCNGTGMVKRIDPFWVPFAGGIELLLANFFGIDLAKIEQEKRAMLDSMLAQRP